MRQKALIREARAYLDAQRIAQSNIAPPLFRLFWKLGIAVPPPLFLGFWANTALLGGSIGISYGAFMSAVFWILHVYFSLLPMLAMAVGMGLCSGLYMAGYYRVTAAKHQIPTWRRYVRSRAGQCAECGQHLAGASTCPECDAFQSTEMQAMPDTDALYAELKPDIALLAEPLFDLSEQLLRKRGNFLPHAAVLTESGEVRLVAAAPSNEVTNAAEVLPLLHNAVRQEAKKGELRGTAVAENVTVTLQSGQRTQAVKVLCEHRRGLAVALYLPFARKFLGRYLFGQTFTTAAKPEVDAWGGNGGAP